MSSRLHITKTPKCYVGGAFIRSESGRVAELLDATGAFFANVPQCTRKDLRNAVEAAAKAGPGWAIGAGVAACGSIGFGAFFEASLRVFQSLSTRVKRSP